MVMDKGEGVFTMAATMQKKMDSKGFFRDYGIILLGVSIFHHYWNDRTRLETFYIGMIAATIIEVGYVIYHLHCFLEEERNK